MRKPTSISILASLLIAGAAGVHAQAVYRIVGPDGKVTFSDRAPSDNTAQPANVSGAGSAATNATLPIELRQVTARFPVTLYTGSDCAPCVSARNLLISRGVPFSERTVSSNEDIEALQRLSGSSSLPFGTIGGQRLAGFSETEWTQYLDAAGYPKQSQLPAAYRRPPATALVAIKATEPASSASQPQSRASSPSRVRAVPRSDTPTPSNPAGIQF